MNANPTNTTARLQPVDSHELELWPYCSRNSALWDLGKAIDVSALISTNDNAENPMPVDNIDGIMMWLFDSMSAYYTLAQHSTVLGPKGSLYILNRLKEAGFRPSPLLNGPKYLEDSARIAYRRLLQRYRSNEARFPRLMRCMMWVACLSTGEADACVQSYLNGDEYSSEAVAHYGGSTVVVYRAWRKRHTVLALNPGRYIR